MKKTILITILLAAILGTALYLYRTKNISLQPATVAGYVVGHISELSPVPASLGGTFFVTSISANEGTGIVSYEDGHNAYTADFTYSSHGRDDVQITWFTVRE